jgi:hypothetical protein
VRGQCHVVGDAPFPPACGVYVLYEPGVETPLYVGVAATQTIEQRWRRQHLRPRAGGSALRRTLGVHLKLVERKLNIKSDGRFYPADVESEITAFLNTCEIAFVIADSSTDATETEQRLIEELHPLLNVKRRGKLRHPRRMQISADQHIELLRGALADAEVPEQTTVLFRIAASPPEGEAEIAYVAPPDAGRINYAAMQAVGSDRLHEYRGIHRFLAFVDVADAPLGALGTELRHEAQHARQFNQHGPHFIDLDRILRDIVRGNTAVRYEQIPSERDANAAARVFALASYAEDLAAMARDDRFQQYTVDVAAADDLLAETLALLWEHAPRDQIDAHTGRALGEVVDELADASATWHQQVSAGADFRVNRDAGQAAVVEVSPSSAGDTS